jgi:hypothetical protein
MKPRFKLIETREDVETSSMKFSNIEIHEIIGENDKLLIYHYEYKIDDGFCNETQFYRNKRLNTILNTTELKYTEDYVSKALFLNDNTLIEEKSKRWLELYLNSHYYNN